MPDLHAKLLRIQNVYHFVFGLKPQTAPFHLLHYLCLASCRAVNRPERIVLHLHYEPYGPLWDLIRPQIEIQRLSAEDCARPLAYQDHFTKSFSYAHVADFIRLRILYEQGGIYADMDTLFLAPPPPEFFQESCVMGAERVDVTAPSSPEGSLCNALIMAEPGAPFIKLWMDAMPDAFDGSWSNHSTFLPYRLSRAHPDLIRVEPESRFFAFDWTAAGIAGLFEEDRTPPPEAISLHLWAHLWWDMERRDMSDFNHERLTTDYVAQAETTFAKLARPFLPPAPQSATRRSRALLLTHIIPDARGVGLARRGWFWAQSLAAAHDLDIVVVTPHDLAPPATPLPGRLHILRATGPALHPRGVADWFEPDAAIAAALGELPGPAPARIVVFRFYLHDAVALLPASWRARAEIDCDDWESATRLSLARLALVHGQIRLALRRLAEARAYQRLEGQALPLYAKVHVAAAEDARRLGRRLALPQVMAAPNQIAIETDFVPVPPTTEARTLLFVGALFYPPNEDAMLWFGRTILPRLRRQQPDLRVIAAGRAEAPLQQRLAAMGIDYVHEPADLSPLYAQAAAVVAPLRGGGGTKLKVLEAWLHERPLIATRHAARGLAVEPGRHLLLADRPADFAASCLRVLQDRALATSLVQEGRRLLHERYLLKPMEIAAA